MVNCPTCRTLKCIGNASFKPQTNNNRTMKTIPTIMTLCALVALPVGAVVAGNSSSGQAVPSEIKAEKEETQTVTLKITGMT